MKISYKVLFAAVLSIAGTNAFAAAADVTGLATTNYVKGAIESLDSSVANANGVINTITVTDGKISATRRQITNNDITDGTINQGKINGLSAALSAKQTTGNMVNPNADGNIPTADAGSTTKYPSIKAAEQIAAAAAADKVSGVTSKVDALENDLNDLAQVVEDNKGAAEDAIKGLTGTGTGTTTGYGMVKTVTQANGKVTATRGLVAKTDLDATLTGEINGKMATADYNTKTTMAADGTYAKKANNVGVNLTELDKGIVAAKAAADGAKSTADSALSKANANATNITAVTNTANQNKTDIAAVKTTADNSLQKAASATFTNGHVLKADANGKVVDGGALGSLATKSTVTDAEITVGTIAKDKLVTAVQTSLGKADTALQKSGTITAGNLLTTNAAGQIIDAGKKGALASLDKVNTAEITDDAVTTAKIKGFDNSGTTKECADGTCALVDLGAGAQWLPIVNEYK